jgi:hypothetical protein
VAISVLEDIHGVEAFAVGEPVKVVDPPIHAVRVPVIVAPAEMVTVAITVQLLTFLYVISAVPILIPVTKPVLETVAIAVLELCQGLEAAAVPVPAN